MKILKIILITLVLGGLVIPLISCASESDSAVSESQIVAVQRGDLTIDITAVGNLSLSLKEDLAFEIGGTTQEPLSVEEILVKEGDIVKEGQILAKLDTGALEETVKTAERAAQTAELTEHTAELSVKTAETNLEQATNDYQELTAPYPYVTYEFLLPESVDTIRVAQARIEEALEENQQGLIGEQYSIAKVKAKLLEAQELITEATTKLAWGFGGGVQPTNIDYWTLRAEQIQVEKAQIALDIAKDSLDKAKISLAIANENLEEAINELEKAVIIAPFDGFITTVNIEGGDEVLKGTIAVQLADPSKFEADILVSEMDILRIELGGDAWVQIDAMQGIGLPAQVTHISPTATIQSGVVNYEMKVEIQSLETVMQERQQAMPDISSGELPEQIKQALEEGRITQEQAEEMMKQRQQGQGGQQRQMPAMLPEEFQLREGLTVTVSIIVDEKTDVLLVPNSAITSQEGKTYVQVVSPDGVTTERSITTGISNWQYTEVTDGLSEGERVVIPQGTTTTPTTSVPRGRIPFFGGGGEH